jgi:hypothetical protein
MAHRVDPARSIAPDSQVHSMQKKNCIGHVYAGARREIDVDGLLPPDRQMSARE